MAKIKSYIPKYSRERQKKRQLTNLFVATIPKKDLKLLLTWDMRISTFQVF